MAAPGTRTGKETLVGSGAACALLLVVTTSVHADSLLYDNGPDAFDFFAVQGSANSINTVSQVSDEFVVGSAATIDRAVFAELTLSANYQGTLYTATPATVQWCIGTSAFGSSVGCGTANISATPTRIAPGNGTDFSSSIALPNLQLAKGTYFLTLTHGTDTLPSNAPQIFLPHNNDYWAATNPSSGNAEGTGVPTGTPHDLNSELSFQVYGTAGTSGGTGGSGGSGSSGGGGSSGGSGAGGSGGGGGGGTAVPEPHLLVLLAGGLLLLALSRRRVQYF